MLPACSRRAYRHMARPPTFNDAKIKALRSAPKGKRREYPDTGERGSPAVPGLVVRVTDRGTKSFVLIARYPGKRSKGEKTKGATYPERRALGTYPEMSLAEAREKARQWRALIAKEEDPAEVEKRQRAAKAEAERSQEAAEAQKQKRSFAAAVEDYIRLRVYRKHKPMRRGKFVANTLRREFVNDFEIIKLNEDGKPVIQLDESGKPVKGFVFRLDRAGNPVRSRRPSPLFVVERVRKGLGDMPLADVRWSHIKERLTDAELRGRPYAAHHLFATVSAFLTWCVKQERVEYSVAFGKEVDAPKARRTRTLSDDEIRALWKATGQLGVYGQLVRFLLLTLQRRTDAGELQRGEIGPAPEPAEGAPFDANPRRRVWTIPAEKFKMGEPVSVYLSDRALAVLDTLTKHREGDYMFATTDGKRPFGGYDKAKKRLDALMLEALKEAAAARSEDPESVKLPPWKLHDLRRVGRSALSRLGFSEEVAEAVIGHAKRGMVKVYNVWDYWDSKPAAMTSWANYLMRIVGEAPALSNVIALREVVR